ncbi:CPBP family intramembrane glutamic endopeptidase [Heliomicrobium modesticaldum]|uniref:CPBP family intramembrane glutamic endopeptidase n=1 Tax=Heliomicrobium modesticaldum TaxID=35701 RepID=UPI0002F630CD|nr:CPBP family intramembrane glutamic endopeptidase [Heliomicrobium modesticaldum]
MAEWNVLKSMGAGAIMLGLAFGGSAWFRRKGMVRPGSGLLLPWGWEAGFRQDILQGLRQGVFVFFLVSLLGGLISRFFPAPPHPVEQLLQGTGTGLERGIAAGAGIGSRLGPDGEPALSTWLLLLFAAAVFAPVAEESFFRGFFLPALARRWGWTKAIHGTAFVFAAMHGDPYRFLPLYVAGYWLGLVVSREGTILPAIVAHAVWNLIGLGFIYLGLLYMGWIG